MNRRQFLRAGGALGAAAILAPYIKYDHLMKLYVPEQIGIFNGELGVYQGIRIYDSRAALNICREHLLKEYNSESKFENFIGSQWRNPIPGQYAMFVSPTEFELLKSSKDFVDNA